MYGILIYGVLCMLWDKIPVERRPMNGFKLRLKRIKHHVLHGLYITAAQDDCYELFGAPWVTIASDLKSPEFTQWYEETIVPLIERRKKELKLITRSNMRGVDVRGLRKHGKQARKN